MKIAVAGTGYVGLVTGVCLAEKGHTVTCVDVVEEKISMLQKGVSPIYEDDLEELLHKNKERLTFTTDSASAYQDAEVIFIGVGTPERQDGSANLSYVYQVATEIAKNAKQECVIVVKSTVPIGTNEKVEELLRRESTSANPFHVASNPEFLAQGTAVRDTLKASRIVIGVEDKYTEEVLREVYKDFDAPLLVTNRRSAEMVKYASNDFLALKISYINEIANLCEIVGADIEDVAKGMGYDARIGNQFLRAGIGYGGSCFPKDTKALSWLATHNGRELKTVKAAIEVNDRQKYRVIQKAREYYEDFKNLTVAVLGLTFKPNTDDLRESPSLVVVPLLLEAGATVKAWDPVGAENFKKKNLGAIEYCETIEDALQKADLCLVLTEWPEVRKMDPQEYIHHMRHPIVIDGRNCYSLKKMKNLEMIYDSIGRKTINNL